MIGSLERETWMLVAANIALGVAVLVLLAAVAGGVISEALRRLGMLHGSEAARPQAAAPQLRWPMRLRLLKGKPF